RRLRGLPGTERMPAPVGGAHRSIAIPRHLLWNTTVRGEAFLTLHTWAFRGARPSEAGRSGSISASFSFSEVCILLPTIRGRGFRQTISGGNRASASSRSCYWED